MDTLVLNKIDGHENDIKEIRNALKNTKDVRLYKRYSVLLKHFEGFTNRNIDEHTVGIYIKNYKANKLDELTMKRSSGKKEE
ncbi:hypothetical protein FC764_10115 [Clostridium botulinum]|nr:hypothetical protein [Clostridium botulinum]